MNVYRYADPIHVTRVWDAIKATKQHQLEFYKIVKHVQEKDECSQQQAETYVRQCIKDKLIVLAKPNPKGADHALYKVTTEEVSMDGDVDWYCFECHRAGEVQKCLNCWRVYHLHCLPKAVRRFELYKATNNYKNPAKDDGSNSSMNLSSDSDEVLITEGLNTTATSLDDKGKWLEERRNYQYDDALCSICNIVNVDTGCDLDRSEMNYLLKFVLDRIRSWLPNTITHTMAQEERPPWITDTELSWRANQLFYAHKDMSLIEVNLNSDVYEQLADFLADVFIIQHNVIIFHGLDSQEHGASELMVRDTLHDLTELKNCADCYKHSNEKFHQKWFCLPCRNQHTLVWAKQKGYPYWPAKILKETPNHYDVRFFGSKYERAVLLKNFVKPISTPKESLQIKPSAGFTRALQELEYHKRLLVDPEELAQFIASSKPGRKTLNKQRNSMLHTPQQKVARTKAQGSHSSAKKRRSENASLETDDSSITGNVIAISDGEDDDDPYAFRDTGPYTLDDGYEQVTSSTENYRNAAEVVGSTNGENVMQRLDQPYCDAVEKMRRLLEEKTDRKEIMRTAMDCMQVELDKITNNHNDHLKRLFESHNNQISETKKKQWCYNCEQDAIYHCCWNTAYCSQVCQQQHWQAEHKKVCRRKRLDTKE